MAVVKAIESKVESAVLRKIAFTLLAVLFALPSSCCGYSSSPPASAFSQRKTSQTHRPHRSSDESSLTAVRSPQFLSEAEYPFLTANRTPTRHRDYSGATAARFSRIVDLRGGAAPSLPAILQGPGPSLFAQGLALSLVLSADGFRVREHFVSYGYGFSVAAQAAAAIWLYRDSLHLLSALHASGLIVYGLRLVLYCRWRDTLDSFQDLRERLSKPRAGPPPYSFWMICSTLYALLALPTFYVMRHLPVAKGPAGISQAGLVGMAIGLLLETIGDLQKSLFKKNNPDRFCDRGLYKLCRHPNYLGEAVFWSGVWVAAIPSFTIWYHWILASLGPCQIISIILRATKGLERRQGDKYGSMQEFKHYTSKTPVLVPWLGKKEWKLTA